MEVWNREKCKPFRNPEERQTRKRRRRRYPKKTARGAVRARAAVAVVASVESYVVRGSEDGGCWRLQQWSQRRASGQAAGLFGTLGFGSPLPTSHWPLVVREFDTRDGDKKGTREDKRPRGRELVLLVR
ncbi:hypothetical protein Ancab_001072 [Ancistrocladus abbreviatus]